MKRAWAVSIKEMRQIVRDRRTLLILLFIPAFFLFLYGYALNFDIRHVALAVQDRDGTPESRELIARFRLAGAMRTARAALARRAAAEQAGQSRMSREVNR